MIRIEKALDKFGSKVQIDSRDEKLDEKDIDWEDFLREDEEESLFQWKCNCLSSEWKQEREKSLWMQHAVDRFRFHREIDRLNFMLSISAHTGAATVAAATPIQLQKK